MNLTYLFHRSFFMNHLSSLFIALLTLLTSLGFAQSIIPQPSSVGKNGGATILFPFDMKIVGNTMTKRELKIATTSGFFPSLDYRILSVAEVLKKSSSVPSVKRKPALVMKYPDSDELPNEAYRLSIAEQSYKGHPAITIEASSSSGFFYGLQTLAALLEQHKTPSGYALPPLQIVDIPKYTWRGLHLDVSRHFFSVDDVKELLDTMSLFKLNKLHLHLTDGPGWRIHINKYPQLTEMGAWRQYDLDQEWNWKNVRIGKPSDGNNAYGGFYTQKDLRKLISYAARRHIDIIPEIDIPGHCYAALVSYPHLACDTFEPLGNGLSGHDYLCMGNEESFHFVTGVLEEIIALFPKGTPIHLGGDELSNSCGASCSACQKIMKKKNFTSHHELQRWFTMRIIHSLRKREKEVITWDDAYEAGARHQTVMCWRGEETILHAVDNLHPVILCPASNFYFDYYQNDPSKEPKAIGGLIPLEKVFSYTPPSTSSLIKGMQGNIWTEYIKTKPQLEYMAWPRGIALAERAWGSPMTTFEDFTARMKIYLQLLSKKGIHYRPLDGKPAKEVNQAP